MLKMSKLTLGNQFLIVSLLLLLLPITAEATSKFKIDTNTPFTIPAPDENGYAFGRVLFLGQENINKTEVGGPHRVRIQERGGSFFDLKTDKRGFYWFKANMAKDHSVVGVFFRDEKEGLFPTIGDYVPSYNGKYLFLGVDTIFYDVRKKRMTHSESCSLRHKITYDVKKGWRKYWTKRHSEEGKKYITRKREEYSHDPIKGIRGFPTVDKEFDSIMSTAQEEIMLTIDANEEREGIEKNFSTNRYGMINESKKLVDKYGDCNSYIKHISHLLDLRMYDEAIEYVSKAINAYPNWNNLYAQLGNALSGLNRFSEAENIYKTLLSRRTSTYDKKRYVKNIILQGDKDRALTYLQKEERSDLFLAAHYNAAQIGQFKFANKLLELAEQHIENGKGAKVKVAKIQERKRWIPKRIQYLRHVGNYFSEIEKNGNYENWTSPPHTFFKEFYKYSDFIQ